MGIIKPLSSQLANMIAAGEVIERPSSVVKELLENALDAQATRIEIICKDAGRTFIEVRDNGTGMDKADLQLAVERHATSKLTDETQLFRIQTLGFRGEALPSIASVSLCRLESCDGHHPGFALTLEEGNKVLTPFPRSRGTTVIVKDLFYNTPARLKYLKNDAIESSSILDVVTRAALANPHVAWSVVMDDQPVFHTDGRGDLHNTMISLLGARYGEETIPFHVQTPDVTLEGWLGKPSLAKSHRYGMFTSVNHRSVYMSKVVQAIQTAYKPFLPPVRFPFVVFNMTIDPALLDVNVHPAKRDIRFSKEAQFIPLLIENIERTLRQQNLSPEPYVDLEVPSTTQTIRESTFPEDEIEPILLSFEPSTPHHPQLNVLGVIDATYVLCQDANQGYYVIDQHAAHERVHYEEQLALIKEGRYAQAPLVPLLVEVSISDRRRITPTLLAMLNDVGVDLEWFGETSLKANSMPTWALPLGVTYLEDLLHQCLHETHLEADKLRLYAIASKACKKSIKAHDYVDLKSLDVLIQRLFTCQYPYTCPHGRPTMIHYGKSQLEKLFNRTGF